MSQPLAGAEVGFVKVPVSDFARSRVFYRDVLGLTEDFAAEEFHWAQFATGGVPLCLYQPGKGGGSGVPGTDTGIQLRVADARAAYDALEEHATEFGEGADGSAGFTLTDPDGNTIQVLQLG